MGFLLWGLLTLIIGSLFYFIYTLYRDAQYFKDRGVVYLGNGILRVMISLFKGLHMTDKLMMDYHTVKSKKQRFAGAMEFSVPTYFIVDLDLIKQVLVKDFDHFEDRRKLGEGKGNELIKKMLVAQDGERWRALRSKMSPTFTTGKIRRMFSILEESGNKLVKYLEAEMPKSDGVMDVQEGYSKFTMDAIASVAFGIDSKAFDQTDPSLFEQMGSELQFKFTGLAMLRFMFTILSPGLAAFFGITIFDPKAMNFFTEVIKSAIKHRGETKEKREDFLQLMIQARAGQLKADVGGELSQFEKEAIILDKSGGGSKFVLNLDDDDLVAQSVSFMIGGFDTIQGLLLFANYNLAVYPDIQERLFQEVKKWVDENDGKLTYDSVNQMEYMDMFISETLRYYPPISQIERQCTKAFRIPDSNVTIEKGMIVTIPVYGIQRDPKHYPEPDKFDPERFSPENRPRNHPCAYMPFGYGPRNCIAMRLALMEAKMAIAQLVLNFVFEPSEKTPIPMKFANTGSLKPDGGLWLKVQSRK